MTKRKNPLAHLKRVSEPGKSWQRMIDEANAAEYEMPEVDEDKLPSAEEMDDILDEAEAAAEKRRLLREALEDGELFPMPMKPRRKKP